MDPQDETVEKLFTLNEITRPAHRQRILEARITFALAIMLLVAGAALIIRESFQPHADFINAQHAWGALLSIVGGYVLKLHKSAHDQLDRYRKDQDAKELILQIGNVQLRDEEIRKLAEHLLNRQGMLQRLFRN